MYQKKENKHWIAKIMIGAVVVFLVAVAFLDFSPTPKQIEQRVVYGQKQ